MSAPYVEPPHGYGWFSPWQLVLFPPRCPACGEPIQLAAHARPVVQVVGFSGRFEYVHALACCDLYRAATAAALALEGL